jgi:RNA polymerase sigma factor (sigma-70 family)
MLTVRRRILALTGPQKTGPTGKGREARESLLLQLEAPMADRVPDHGPHAATSLNLRHETAFLLRWDMDIRRAARARAHGDRTDEDDLAQHARMRLMQVGRVMSKPPTPYVRAVIANAMKSARRRERRSFSTRSPLAREFPDCLAAPAIEVHDGSEARVAAWIQTLPTQLRNVYQHLYTDRRPQREAARLMRMSQPRVTQLHRQLLERGRRDLACLAA